MSGDLVQTGKSIAEGATYGGGFAWLATNSSAMTALAVILTAIASAYFGWERRKTDLRNAKANEYRNQVNERDITLNIIKKLRNAGRCDAAHAIEDELL